MSSFTLLQRLRSFIFAFQGAKTLLITQHNAWVHAGATVAVIIAGVTLRISKPEWALLVVAIALVWMAEAFNTAIEFLANEVSEEQRERIRKTKDVAAFAVLVGSVAAVAIGALVFLPHLWPSK